MRIEDLKIRQQVCYIYNDEIRTGKVYSLVDEYDKSVNVECADNSLDDGKANYITEPSELYPSYEDAVKALVITKSNLVDKLEQEIKILLDKKEKLLQEIEKYTEKMSSSDDSHEIETNSYSI